MEGKNYTRWSESMKHKLAVQVLRQNGYKRTGETMEKKWKTIAELLSADQEFSNSAITLEWNSLRKQFARLQEAVVKETGTDKPGVNLSGLAEKPSDFQILMLNMAEEVANSKGAKDVDKAKKARLQENLLTHESATLQQQVLVHYADNVVPGPPAADPLSGLTDSSNDESNKKVSLKRKGQNYLEEFTSKMEALAESESKATQAREDRLTDAITLLAQILATKH
jgi:hypothetical protein